MHTIKETIEFTISLFLGMAVITLLVHISDIIAWIVAALIVMFSGYKFGRVLLKALMIIFKIK